ncbi:MAG: hypothetical protein ACPGDB_04265 [Fusobacterium sp.]
MENVKQIIIPKDQLECMLKFRKNMYRIQKGKIVFHIFHRELVIYEHSKISSKYTIPQHYSKLWELFTNMYMKRTYGPDNALKLIDYIEELDNNPELTLKYWIPVTLNQTN